jgi:integrase
MYMPRKRTTGIEPLEPGLYRIRFGWTCPKTGRRKEVDRRVAGTLHQAQAEMARLREAVQVGNVIAPRVRLRDYCVSWLEDRKGRLKYSSVKSAAGRLAAVADSPIGDIFLDSLTPSDVRGWLASLHAAGYAPATLVGYLSVLRQVTRDAHVELELPRWACHGVRIPVRVTGYTDDRPNLFQTRADLDAFLASMKEHEPQWYPLVYVLAWTGLRFSEATALQWGDVNEETREIRVRRGQVGGRVDSTKTGKPRTVVLTDGLRDVLRQHRPSAPSEWVFLSRAGTLLASGCLSKPFARTWKRLGKDPAVTPHGLRRTLNNWLRAISHDVARAMVGHTTEAMTLHYSHISTAEKLAAVEQVFGAPPGVTSTEGREVDPHRAGIRAGVDVTHLH